MKEFKIRTYGNKNLSEAIQLKLFELGYKSMLWSLKKCPAKTYGIWAHSDGGMTRDTSWDLEFFEGHEFSEISINELFEMEAKNKETVTIGDSVFDKAEFEEATKNLKPIKSTADDPFFG